MADERIDIEIVDKVQPAIQRKLQAIAEAARVADSGISRLKTALDGLKGAGLTQLATASARMEQASAKAAIAQQKLATEMKKTEAASAKVAISELAVESALNRAIKAEAQSAAALQKLAAETAKAKAATDAANLSYYKEEAALNKAVVAEKKAAQASEQLKVSTIKTSTAQNQNAASASRAEMASIRLASAQKKVAESTNSSSFSFGAMKAQLMGVVAALGSVYAILSKADEYAQLENRLRSTGLEGDNLTSIMGRLTDSANNTRSSLGATVELYSRLAISSKELGVTQSQLIDFTTSLNQAIILSGASTTEAQAGLIQLSQGMASGTLRGDELRSVLEQLPAVADVIAKSLGVTRGELRQLGTDGKISVQTILKAFQEAGPELSERFAGQATTASQAIEVLKNKTMELAGKEGKGSLDQFTGGINDLTKSLDDLKPVLSGIAWLFETISKTVRVLLLGVQYIYTGVLPMMFSSLGQLMTGFNDTLTSWLKRIVNVASYVLPDAIGGGLKSMVAGLETYNADSLKWFKEIESNAVDSMARISDTFAEIYAYKPPEAGGETPEAVLAMGAERRKKEAEEAEKRKKAAEEAEKQAKKAAELRIKLAKEAAEADAKARADSNEAAEKAYRDALARADAIANAYKSIRAEVDNMRDVIGMTDKELSVHNQLLSYREQLGGAAGSEAFLTQIEKELNVIYDQNAAFERQKAIRESVKRTDFASAMDDLQNSGLDKTGQQDYLVSTNSELFAGTMEAAEANVRTYEDMYARINAMREAEYISESTASQMRSKMWVMENEYKAQATSDFFGNLATMQASSNKKMHIAGKAAAVAQATIDGILAVQKALAAYPPPISFAMAASTGVAAAVNVAKITGVAGFQTGGYTGNAGVSDVAGVVHGREYVMDAATVQRVGVDNLDAIRSGAASVQQPSTSSAGFAGNNQTSSQGNIRVINVIDPGMVGDWMQTSEGEKVILNTIRNNSDAIRETVNA